MAISFTLYTVVCLIAPVLTICTPIRIKRLTRIKSEDVEFIKTHFLIASSLFQ